MPQDYDLQDYSEPDQQDYGPKTYDLQDYKEPQPGFLEGLYRVPQEMYEGASKAGKSAYEHLKEGQYPEAFHDITAPFIDPLEQALKGTIRLSQGKSPIDVGTQEQAKRTGISQVLGAAGLPGEEFQKAWEEGNYPYLAGQTVGALGTMYLGHRVNKAFTEPKPSGPAGGSAQGGTPFPEFDTKIPQESPSSPHPHLPFDDFGPQIPKEPGGQGGLPFDTPDWMNKPELTPEELSKKAKTATLDEPTPLKIAQMRQRGYVPLETTVDGKLKLIRKDLAQPEPQFTRSVEDVGAKKAEADAATSEVPDAVSTKGLDPTDIALLKSKGYMPGGRGPDGYAQLVKAAAVAPPTVRAPKPNVVPGATPEGGIALRPGEDVQLPNPSQAAIDNLEEAGLKLVGKTPEGLSIFKWVEKQAGNQRGVLNFEEIYNGVRDGLRSLFGHDPTEQQVREEAHFQLRLARIRGEGQDTPQIEHDPNGPNYQIHDVNGDHWVTYPSMNEPYGPFPTPRDTEGWVRGHQEISSAPRRSEFIPEESQGIYDLQPVPPVEPPKIGRESLASTDWLNQNRPSNIPETTGPVGEQGSLFPMEMRRNNQLGNIDGLTPEDYNKYADVSNVPQRELPFEPRAGRRSMEGPSPEQLELGFLFERDSQGNLKFKRSALDNIPTEQLASIRDLDPTLLMQGLSHSYAQTELSQLPSGPPGLEFVDRFGGHSNDDFAGYDLTYRSPTGVPIAHASASKIGRGEPLKVSTLVSDKNSGLYGRAMFAIAQKLGELGAQAPSGLYSGHTKNLIERLQSGEKSSEAIAKSEKIRAASRLRRGIPPGGGMGGQGGFINMEEIFNAMGDVKDAIAEKLGAAKKALPEKVGGLFAQGPQGQPSTFDEALNLSDAATTTADFSMPLRQGWSQVFTPEWRRAIGPMFKGAFSEDKARAIDAEIRAKPIFTDYVNPNDGRVIPSVAKRAGMKLIEGSKISASENEAASNWIESGGNIPYASKAYRETLGKVAKVSNRAAATFLNHLRANTFERLMDSARDMSVEAGQTGEARPGLFKQKFTPEQAADLNPYKNDVLAKELADYVNTATGRGPLKTHLLPYTPELNIEGSAKLLKYGLFSPRNIASKVRMLNPSTYVMASPFARKQYLKSMLGVTAAWSTVAGLAKGAGAITGVDTDVSLDPDSADFGKIRIGNVRLDPGGGFLQYLVAAHRMYQGGWTSSATNQYHRFGSGFRAETMGDMQERFFVNKLKPVTKFAYDLAHASEYQPFAVGDRILQMYVPLVVQDVMELAKEDPKLVPWLTPLITGGMGSQIYSKGEAVSKFIDPENDWNVTGGGIRDLMPWNFDQ